MQPEDDEQLAADNGRRMSIGRDTLVLIGALAFLILAVGLTFFFPGAPGAPVPEAETQIALEGGTATPAVVVPTEAAYPGPGSGLEGGNGAYPGPGPAEQASPTPFSDDADETPEPVGYPPPRDTPTPTADAPAFQPTTVTLTPAVQTFVPAPTLTPIPVPTQPPSGFQPAPTQTPQPPVATPIPAPTQAPTNGDQPTTAPEPGKDAPGELSPTPEVLAEPVEPVDVLRGNVRWNLSDSPILVPRNLQLAPGAVLIIEPGVEVRLAPGVAIFVDSAQLLALGLPERPISFMANGGLRWGGIFVRPNSFVAIENTTISGGGAGGTVIVAEESEMVVRSSRIVDNGGQVLLANTKLEMRDSEIAGNDMPYGAALDVSYSRRNFFFTLVGNRIGGNRQASGAPGVRVVNSSTFDTLNIDVQGNLIRGGIANLELTTNGLLKGTVACNALIGGDLGLSIRSQTRQQVPLPELRFIDNELDEHTPPIIPIYLDFGIGRGAASELPIDMTNNWWGEASGPYDPLFHADGRGDSVGRNIEYMPWRESRPACVPLP